MESAAPGRVIAGRYQLGAVVGRGGMGIVWQARDELLGRDVAVKELIWPTYLSAEERQAARRRAVREARAAACLSHRNVIQVFDILEEEGCPWIVMELLSPRSLRDVVRQQGPLSPAQAAQLGLDILAALRAAHALGIVHRDVKPANILMAPDRAVLVDFGIAQAESPAGATTASMLIGSPAYISPERARGGSSGPPADLWGLGASLYAAVEGNGPFEREGGALASLTAVVADEPELATNAGPLLWPVICGLLRKDPGERLDAVQAERMLRLVVAPVSPATSVSRGRRRPKAVAAALAGTAVLVAGAATMAVTDRPSQARHQAAATVPSAAPTGPRTQPASTPAAGTGNRYPAAGVTTGASAGAHVTSRRSSAPSLPAAGSDRAGVKSHPGKAVPPGHSARPSKPGKGKKTGQAAR